MLKLKIEHKEKDHERDGESVDIYMGGNMWRCFITDCKLKKIIGRKREIDQNQENPRKIIAKSTFSYKVTIHNFNQTCFNKDVRIDPKLQKTEV